MAQNTNEPETKSTQQRARECIDAEIADSLHKKRIERDAVSQVMEDITGDRLFELLWPDGAIWPALKFEHCSTLLNKPLPLLCEISDIDPTALLDALQEIWLSHIKAFHKHGSEWEQNKHLKTPAKLRKLVKQRLQHSHPESVLQNLPFVVSDREDCSQLKNPDRVRRNVLLKLNDRLLKACRNEPLSRNAQLALKKFTVLTVGNATSAERSAHLEGLKTGATRELPFIVRNLKQGKLPNSVNLPSCKEAPCLSESFPPQLAQLVPQVDWIEQATKSFLNRNGILEQFLDTNAPIAPDLEKEYGQFGKHVQLKNGGIHIPRKDALVHNRRTRYALPDGVSCIVSLIALIEWVLHQAVHTCLGETLPRRPKPTQSIRKLKDSGLITLATLEELEILYSTEALSIRDSILHSAFIANDPDDLRNSIKAILWVLAHLFNDLKASGKLPIVLSANRWDDNETIPQTSTDSALGQYNGSNLFDQFDGDAERQHVFKIFTALTPDKATFGRSAILLWRDQEDARDNYRAFVGLICALIECEELFRAILELYQETSIVLYRVGDSEAKVDLAFFDRKDGHLLDSKILETILPEYVDNSDFQDALVAMYEIRNALFHGKWRVLDSNLLEKLHLIVKMLFLVSGKAITAEDKRRENWIRENAYYRSLNRGTEGGKEVDDWLAAELEFEKQKANTSK